MSALRVNSGTAKQRPPEGGLCIRHLKTSGEAEHRLALSAIGHEAKASKAEDHHGPGGGLRDGWRSYAILTSRVA
jgi:hypothetical protein